MWYVKPSVVLPATAEQTFSSRDLISFWKYEIKIRQKLEVPMKMFTVIHCYSPELYYYIPKVFHEYSFTLLAPFVGGWWYYISSFGREKRDSVHSEPPSKKPVGDPEARKWVWVLCFNHSGHPSHTGAQGFSRFGEFVFAQHGKTELQARKIPLEFIML